MADEVQITFNVDFAPMPGVWVNGEAEIVGEIPGRYQDIDDIRVDRLMLEDIDMSLDDPQVAWIVKRLLEVEDRRIRDEISDAAADAFGSPASWHDEERSQYRMGAL